MRRLAVGALTALALACAASTADARDRLTGAEIRREASDIVRGYAHSMEGPVGKQQWIGAFPRGFPIYVGWSLEYYAAGVEPGAHPWYAGVDPHFIGPPSPGSYDPSTAFIDTFVIWDLVKPGVGAGILQVECDRVARVTKRDGKLGGWLLPATRCRLHDMRRA